MISFLHFRLLNLKYRYDFSELQIKQAAIFVYISVVKHLFVRTETNALPHYICINPEVNCRVSAVVIHDRNRGDATVGEFGYRLGRVVTVFDLREMCADPKKRDQYTSLRLIEPLNYF